MPIADIRRSLDHVILAIDEASAWFSTDRIFRRCGYALKRVFVYFFGGLLFCLILCLWRILLLSFPFAWRGAATASKAIAIATVTVLILQLATAAGRSSLSNLEKKRYKNGNFCSMLVLRSYELPIADICRVIPCCFQIVADQFAGPVAQARKLLCSFAFRYYFFRRATTGCR